jgi:transcriptional regulator with XRE-family HTH domain
MAMAQRPAQLTPLASAWHFFGAELRHWRQHRGMSLEQLGRAAHVCGDLIGKIEKAQRWPDPSLVHQLDTVLDSGGILGRLFDLAQHERRTSTNRNSTTTTLIIVIADEETLARQPHAEVPIPDRTTSTAGADHGTVVPISAASRRQEHRRQRIGSTGTPA